LVVPGLRGMVAVVVVVVVVSEGYSDGMVVRRGLYEG
jgi:hypothetical protein